MAVFRPAQRVCELNFNDEYYYSLPLHEDTADAIDAAVKKLEKIAPKDRGDVDEAYNLALDILDELLGEGAAADIMTMFDKPGTLEVWDVLFYIISEWKEAYTAELDKIKKATPAAPARAERRARR